MTLTLTDEPAGVVLGTPGATGTIRDDDRLSVTVEGDDRVVAGDSATYRFRLTGGTTGSAGISVAYSATGAAGDTETIAAGRAVSDDFTVSTGSLTTGSLVVRVTDVNTDAGTVSSGVGRSKSTQIRPTGTALVSVAAAANVEETANASASFAVTLDGSAPGVTVQYQVSAGSASTADFTVPTERTVTVPGTITVPIVNDNVAEGPETFTVTLSSPRSTDNAATVELGRSKGTATIAANDSLTAEVRSPDTTVLEGNSATFVVDLGGTSSTSVEVDYTVMGSGNPAAGEGDFTPEKGKLTIPAGRSTGTIEIEAVDDDILEPDETLQVMLTGAAPGNVVTVDQDPNDNGSATTVIGANGSTVTVSQSQTEVTVTEGGKALFPVVLSGKVAGDLTVGYGITAPSTDGATDGTDFTTATPREVVVKEGETTATIEVNTTPDSQAENTEAFTLTLTLTDEPAGVVLGTPGATGTIRDDDRLSVTVGGR